MTHSADSDEMSLPLFQLEVKENSLYAAYCDRVKLSSSDR